MLAIFLEQEIQAEEEKKRLAESSQQNTKMQKDLHVAKIKQENQDPVKVWVRTYHRDLSQSQLNSRKNEMATLYNDHFLPMIKHLEHRIFHQESQTMTPAERSEFLQSVLDPNGIEDPNNAWVFIT